MKLTEPELNIHSYNVIIYKILFIFVIIHFKSFLLLLDAYTLDDDQVWVGYHKPYYNLHEDMGSCS